MFETNSDIRFPIPQVDNRPQDAAQLPTHAGLNGKFADIAWQIWTKVEEQQLQTNRTTQLTWSGQMLGAVLQLCCRYDEAIGGERADEVFNKLDREAHRVEGIPTAAAIEEYVELCVRRKQPSRGVAALQYHVEKSLGDGQRVAGVLRRGLTLDEVAASKVDLLVGREVAPEELKMRE